MDSGKPLLDDKGQPLRYSYFTAKEQLKAKIEYKVKFLEREDGINWVRSYRLPIFLKSELFSEYELARQLANVQIDFIDRLVSEGIEELQIACGQEANHMNQVFSKFQDCLDSAHSG